MKPLSEEVGESLLDYLRDGRPHALYPEVFLTVHRPYSLWPPKHQYDFQLHQGGYRNAPKTTARLAGGVTMKNHDFVSVVADRFSDYVTCRRLGGVQPKRQIGLLRFFGQ